MYLRGKQLSNSIVSHLETGNKISEISTFVNISFLKSHSEKVSQQQSKIDIVINRLENAVNEDSMLDAKSSGRLHFLIEQLRLSLISQYKCR